MSTPLVEPAIVPDIFVTGNAPTTTMGDNLRLTLFVAQRSTLDCSPENVVVARIVGSRSDMLRIAAAIVRGCNSTEKAAEAFEAFLDAPTTGRH
ncbi:MULTISPECIES: hypothetical protein [unclassified Mesorhizobium]|uniref:hypothetical protein n=1 Tax=unclassified Mesorhizobium TaxID=325217 RepID=UPI000FCC3019|nr:MULTISPECIES: hypothetical protein [unclassified Mesorhizobium]RUX97259.1 hypothetical protein EN993_04410 [Mesorhizobium sp. M7D.F.Ca.US.004.01.2.1]RVA35055.1 hypothetical protein EN935_05130 [Mesorhizobium sp. M7D.F.Ca.US.004.03.1.1]